MEALLVAALPCRKGASPMTVLRQRMTQDMQVRNLSRHTQASYLQQVSLFARHFGKSPDALTPEHIRTYQIYLTNEKKLAAGSIHIAVAALRFLYKTPSSGNGPSRMCFRFPRSRRNCPSF
jgi:site-specific recombinase XerD